MLVAVLDVVVVEGLPSGPLGTVVVLVGTADCSGTIFIDVDVVLLSLISLALVPHNLEPHISLVLMKLLGWEDGMLLECRTRPPPLCSTGTGGMEELMRAVSPSAMAFSNPPLPTIWS